MSRRPHFAAWLPLLLLTLAIGCEPSKQELFFVNARDLLRDARAEKLPERTNVMTANAACKKAKQESGRLRAARKLADDCDPMPEVWYYRKALAAFPEAIATASDLSRRVRQACDAANTTLGAFTSAGLAKDRERVPEARQLAEECDRSSDRLSKPPL